MLNQTGQGEFPAFPLRPHHGTYTVYQSDCPGFIIPPAPPFVFSSDMGVGDELAVHLLPGTDGVPTKAQIKYFDVDAPVYVTDAQGHFTIEGEYYHSPKYAVDPNCLAATKVELEGTIDADNGTIDMEFVFRISGFSEDDPAPPDCSLLAEPPCEAYYRFQGDPE